MRNELLLVLAFNNNNFYLHAHFFRPSSQEQVVDFEPQLLRTDINEEPCKFIDLLHELLKNEDGNEDRNKVVEN